jgi:hypothetical protein
MVSGKSCGASIPFSCFTTPPNHTLPLSALYRWYIKYMDSIEFDNCYFQHTLQRDHLMLIETTRAASFVNAQLDVASSTRDWVAVVVFRRLVAASILFSNVTHSALGGLAPQQLALVEDSSLVSLTMSRVSTQNTIVLLYLQHDVSCQQPVQLLDINTIDAGVLHVDSKESQRPTRDGKM